jgi:hypothetical protein
VAHAARIYRTDRAGDDAHLFGRLAAVWRRPDLAVDGISRAGRRAWTNGAAATGWRAAFDIPVWCGVGRTDFPTQASGEAIVLWDAADGASGAADGVHEQNVSAER